MFDTSAVIGISDIRRPDLFDQFRKLGYKLAVPSHVYREEVISADARTMIGDLVDRAAVRIVCVNRRSEVVDFKERFQGTGLGECDAILSCIKMRRRGENARCVLDEKGARAAAAQSGVERVGLVGLLGELLSSGTVTAQEMGRMATALRRTNFRVSDDLLGGLTRGI